MMRASSNQARVGAALRRRQRRGLAGDKRGLAAIEFALIGGTLIFGLFNMIDFGRYLYAKMEVQNAAQMGVQLVWNTCNTPNLPATTACANESVALTTGVQSTSLGTAVTVVSGYPTEGWYCVNGSGALVSVAAITTAKPADCTAAGVAANQPADYFVVQTTYTYAPLFTAFSVANVLPTPITSTNYMRMQ
jgi:Flp pilus assembly protein TadG